MIYSAVQKYADYHKEVNHFPQDKAHNDAFLFMGHTVENPGKGHDKYQRPRCQGNARCRLCRVDAVNLRQDGKRTDYSDNEGEFIEKYNIARFWLLSEPLPTFVLMPQPEIMHTLTIALAHRYPGRALTIPH